MDISRAKDRLDPRTKIITAILLVIVVLLTPISSFVRWIVLFTFVSFLLFFCRISTRQILRGYFKSLPMMLLITLALPFQGNETDVVGSIGVVNVHKSGLAQFASMNLKFSFILLTTMWLTQSTSITKLVQAVEAFRAPTFVSATIYFTLKFVDILGEESRRQLTAFRARSIKLPWHIRISFIGKWAAMFFTRTIERSDRIFHAMLARGFNGSIPALYPLQWQRVDSNFTVLVFAVLGLTVIFGINMQAEIKQEKNTPAILLNGVNFKYPDGQKALSNLHCEIQSGEHVAVIGANGAGKSTFLKVASGILPAEGEIVLAGVRIEKKNLTQIRQIIGLVFQNPDDQLFCPTVAEDVAFGPMNVGLSAEQARIRVHETLAELDLSAYENRSTLHLSFGERKLIALATVMAMRPRILAFDEPSSNLDLHHRRRLIEWIRKSEHTILMTSHDLDMIAETCHRAVIIDHGRIVKIDDTSKILTDEKLLTTYQLELPFFKQKVQFLSK